MAQHSGFTPVALAEIPEGAVPWDLHFPMGEFPSRKLVCVHPKGKPLTKERKKQLTDKSIEFFWIPEAEAQTLPRLSAQTLAHALLGTWLRSAKSAQEEQTIYCSFQIVRRWIRQYLNTPIPEWDEVSELALESALSSHAMRVSLLVVIFAMGYENEDLPILQDLSLAGLLHDLGDLSIGILPYAWNAQKARQAEDPNYKAHPEESIRLIEKLAPAFPAQAKPWIIEHHEQFGGGGFPKRLEAYQINDLSLLLGMADVIDELSSGLWDGNRRGLRQAFSTLPKLNLDKIFPQWFNPDVLKTVLSWVSSLAGVSVDDETAADSGKAGPVTPNSAASSPAA